ncbi:MAG: TonB-dependent receptor [Paludibacter sp.]|nr:TonB-dependent receptor [Paludibacter sp.]
MKTTYKIVFLTGLFMLLNSFSLLAVTATAIIKGKVVNDKNEPVEFATAVLLSPVTGEVVKGEVCNEKGEFNINKVDKGEYVLSVSMVGYKKVETQPLVVDGKRSVIEQTIVLNEQAELLKTVEIVGNKEFIEQNVDKLVINPEASITSASENVYELLRKLPGVSIDNSDNITLKGMQGVRVLIDDKPTYLSAQQLASWLKSMQGKDVDKIEIIENPSARYDAEGNSGIINIKTKHVRAPGFNGAVNGGLSLSERIGWNGGINLNMNYGKINLYGNYSTYNWAGWNGMDAVRRFTSTGMEGASHLIHNLGNYKGGSHTYKVGADYFIAKSHVISLMMRTSQGRNSEDMESKTIFVDQAQHHDSSLITLSDGNNDWKNNSYNLNYKWDIDTTGQVLLFDIDYARFRFNSYNDQEGTYYDAANTATNNKLLTITSQGNDIRIFTSKIDHTLPLSKTMTLESGVKVSEVTTESFIDMDGSLSQHDHFIYSENIWAAYANARAQFNKTTLQVGLRLENTRTIGNSVEANIVNDTSYLKLFPSVFVQQQLNERSSLNFRYSYRIGRPSYHHLNPFKWMIDPYTFNLGNPNLKPQFTHTAALSHNLNNKLISNLGVNFTSGMFTEVIRQDDASQTVYQTLENLSASTDLSLSETLQLQPLEWWRLNGTVTGMYKTITMKAESADALSKFSVMATMSNNFTLPLGIDLELSGRYMSEQLISNIILRPRYSFDIGVQKRLFNNQGTLKVALVDIFNTNTGSAYAKYDNVDIEVKNTWDSRKLNLTFSYRFGKDDFKTRANRSTSSSEEQNRSAK